MDKDNVKQEWKKAGSDLGHAFAGLGMSREIML